MNSAVLNNIVRIGTVSSVNSENRTARVAFADKKDTKGNPLPSGQLKIVRNSPFIPAQGAAQETQTADGHKHGVIIKPWLPEVGELVLCVFLPNGESDGFVVGGI